MGAYALVFKVLLDVANIPDYPIFLLAGLIVWVFFAQALLAAAPSLVLNAPLVRKVRFPRETIPASVATVQLVTFLAMLVLLLPVALLVRDSLDPALLLLPFVVAFLFCLVLGLSMLVAVAACALPRRRAGARRGAAAVVLPHAAVPARSRTSRASATTS